MFEIETILYFVNKNNDYVIFVWLINPINILAMAILKTYENIYDFYDFLEKV